MSWKKLVTSALTVTNWTDEMWVRIRNNVERGRKLALLKVLAGGNKMYVEGLCTKRSRYGLRVV